MEEGLHVYSTEELDVALAIACPGETIWVYFPPGGGALPEVVAEPGAEVSDE